MANKDPGGDTSKIAVFNGNVIRKTVYDNEWWFSVIDVVAVLTVAPMHEITGIK